MDESDPIEASAEGPAEAPTEPSYPPEATVHRVHDRFLIEVVEDLGLCPFARKCRETARLERPLFYVRGDSPSVSECADSLIAIAAAQPDVEVVLMTFVVPDGHPLCETARFDRFQRAFRAEIDARSPVRFYTVCFHPQARSGVPPARLQPHSLAPLLRRTPDPVIQCVRADLLDRVREDSERLHRRIRSEPDFEIRALLAASMSTASDVSDDIAQHNFVRVGTGQGRAELEARLADISDDRARSYGRRS